MFVFNSVVSYFFVVVRGLAVFLQCGSACEAEGPVLLEWLFSTLEVEPLLRVKSVCFSGLDRVLLCFWPDVLPHWAMLNMSRACFSVVIPSTTVFSYLEGLGVSTCLSQSFRSSCCHTMFESVFDLRHFCIGCVSG